MCSNDAALVGPLKCQVNVDVRSHAVASRSRQSEK